MSMIEDLGFHPQMEALVAAAARLSGPPGRDATHGTLALILYIPARGLVPRLQGLTARTEEEIRAYLKFAGVVLDTYPEDARADFIRTIEMIFFNGDFSRVRLKQQGRITEGGSILIHLGPFREDSNHIRLGAEQVLRQRELA